MKKKIDNKKKLSLKKLQMAKLNNLNTIFGGKGGGLQPIDGCVNGDDGSIIIDDGINPKTI